MKWWLSCLTSGSSFPSSPHCLAAEVGEKATHEAAADLVAGVTA
mgnify:CR=1 FL=1